MGVVVASKSPFIPLHVEGKDGAATPEDLNRVQDQIRAAFKKVQQGGVTKVTSNDGSVIVNPKTGVGEVDLSVFEDEAPPGSVSISVGTCGPAGLTSGLPTKFLKITKDGTTYMVPAWLWTPPPPSDFPTTGLVGWWKSDAGVTADGSGFISAVADQSGHGYDLAFESAKPLLVTPGSGLPFINFSNGTTNTTALLNTSLPWGTSYSALVVAQDTSGSNGRLLDFNYPSANRYLWALHGSRWGYTQDDVGGGTTGNFADDIVAMFLITVDPSTISMYQDVPPAPSFASPVATDSSHSPPATTGVRFGSLPSASQDSVCMMWEAAVWDHVLSSSERARLCAYLATRSY